jgi:bacterioferritin
MRGNVTVLTALNKVLTRKLTAVNQFFLHARMYKNWGFAKLNQHIYKASIAEMKYADEVIERILLLDGLPNLQELGKLYIGETPHEMLKLDDKLVSEDIHHIRDAISVCEEEQDFVSRKILSEILAKQEEHQDWLDTQCSIIDTIGEENYLQQQR